MTQTQTDKLVPAIYGRYKGAEWFPALYKRHVMILGLGGIGSFLAFFMARTGAKLALFDKDEFEAHNGGQMMRQCDIGQKKTNAMRDIIANFSPDCEVSGYLHDYGRHSITNDIVLCGFDNMAARKAAFANWQEMLAQRPDHERKQCFFQDGRLLAEQLQIYNIPGDRPDLIAEYAQNHLPESGEILEVDCTLRQTTHCAGLIGAKMTSFVTNWISNVAADSNYRAVPFYYEELIPVNVHTTYNPPPVL